MSSPINVTGQENFLTEVIKSDLPVLVDFWAHWCGPCQMMAPVLTELATKFDGKLKVVKVDTEEAQNQQLAMDYQIQSIPNMKLFIKGELVKDFIGYRSTDTFTTELKEFLD
jgi:thioredoxin 1